MSTVNLQQMFADYKRDDEITVVPAGTYQMSVLRATVRPGAKGPGIMPVFKVIGGPYAGKTVIAGQFTASEAGRSIFFRQLKGFGLDEQFFAQGATIEQAAAALVDRQVQVNITVRPWQGEDRNNIAIGGVQLLSLGADPGAGVSSSPPAAQTAAPVPVPVQQPSAPVPAPQPEVAQAPAPAPVAAPAAPVGAAGAPPPIPQTGAAPF